MPVQSGASRMFPFQDMDRNHSVLRGAVIYEPKAVSTDDVTDIDRAVREQDGQKTPLVIQCSAELPPGRCLVVVGEASAELTVRLTLDLHQKR